MYIIKKKISGKDYYYLRKAVRKGKKVRSEFVAYLGKNLKEAEEKAKEITEKSKLPISQKGDKENELKKGVKITYFVHGTTIDNEKGKATGQADGELAEIGKRQSIELIKHVKNKKFDVVLTSDLKRAVDSADLTFKDFGINIIKDRRLRECNYGDLNQADEEKVVYLDHIDKPFPNGESLIDVEKRIKSFLEDLQKSYIGKNIAVVAHKAPQLALDVLLENKTWENAIKEDWRLKKTWQPGWEYFIKPGNQVKTMENKQLTIDELANFCKEKGFVFRSSDIYGGMAGFWDFGPLGVELFNNIKKNWWDFFVKSRENMVGMEASIISNPKVWEASGHVANFNDISVKCKRCKKSSKIDEKDLGKLKCECGGEYENMGKFNLMFKTRVGTIDAEDAYLRGETAQGMFTDFKLVQQTSRMQLPFGIAQIGRCFRNEIAPRDFLFRSREFHIGEFEFFINPEETRCELLTDIHKEVKVRLLDAETQKKGKEELRETSIGNMIKEKRLDEWHAFWLAEQVLWFNSIGLLEIKIREHTKDELSHYSSATFDIDYEYVFGSKEIAGIANRGQYDLKQHEKFSIL
ncbi:MAG: glycine--tRNA ligase [Candidatus Nanoarchaeia archaeon]|nr:glycine--tRNA ligase [Candidatus Nanoarchaeia archaeon]